MPVSGTTTNSKAASRRIRQRAPDIANAPSAACASGPKSEWLPLELPESLRIVPRDRWERVQQQLDRNIAFSPRNEKHAYLLKGLVTVRRLRSPIRR